jgi:hypothetical protein
LTDGGAKAERKRPDQERRTVCRAAFLCFRTDVGKVNDMTDTNTIAKRGPNRDTTAATARHVRLKEERRADQLREWGWLTFPPERAEEVRAALAAAGVIL